MHGLKDYLSAEVVIGAGKRSILLRTLAILVLYHDGRHCVALYRLSQYFERKGYTFLARRLEHRVRRKFGCYLSRKSTIDIGLSLPHPTGIVVGIGVRIGRNCIIYQQVTLGGAAKGDADRSNYPVVGDDVILWAGAKVVGAVEIGSDAQVGTNAVVLSDVPARHVAVGIPAQARPPRDRRVA